MWEVKTEVYFKDKNDLFQWTCDIVLINEEEKKAILFDLKSWEITKKAFWLEQKLNKNGSPPKPTEKLKKLALQLSLYARILEQMWYEIMWLYWVWLHDSWCYEYEVGRWTDEELDALLSSFFIRNTEIPPNFTILIKNMSRIEIQTVIPEQLYSKASIILEENDLEWKTYEEKIDEAIRLQKYLIKQYTEWNL